MCVCVCVCVCGLWVYLPGCCLRCIVCVCSLLQVFSLRVRMVYSNVCFTCFERRSTLFTIVCKAICRLYIHNSCCTCCMCCVCLGITTFIQDHMFCLFSMYFVCVSGLSKSLTHTCGCMYRGGACEPLQSRQRAEPLGSGPRSH